MAATRAADQTAGGTTMWPSHRADPLTAFSGKPPNSIV